MTRVAFVLLAAILLLPSIAQASDRSRVRTRAISIDEEGVNDEAEMRAVPNGSGEGRPEPAAGYQEVEWTVRANDVSTVTDELTESLAQCGIDGEEVAAAVARADEDGDGSLTDQELGNFRAAHNRRHGNLCMLSGMVRSGR